MRKLLQGGPLCSFTKELFTLLSRESTGHRSDPKGLHMRLSCLPGLPYPGPCLPRAGKDSAGISVSASSEHHNSVSVVAVEILPRDGII